MSVHTAVLRILKLIRILGEPLRRSKAELALQLGVSRRTLYRDLDTVKALGFALDQDDKACPYLVGDKFPNPDVRFDSEEAELLLAALDQSAVKGVPLESLHRKLYLNSDLQDLPGTLSLVHKDKLRILISRGMRDRLQLLLKNYHSASSGKIGDRRVEALTMDRKMEMLMAWELASQKLKQYKLDRMEGVELTDERASYSGGGQDTDIFGMSGDEVHSVILNLSHRAYRLLIEEYPEARAYTAEQEGDWPYRYSGEVYAWEGVGRFVLGLLDQVEVVAPRGLRIYVKGKTKKYLEL